MVVLETPLVTVVRKEEALNLVKFCDTKEWYSLEEDIHLELLFDSRVKGSTLDWVGIFREDWNTFESFVAFQRGLGKAINPDTPRRRKIVFPFNKDLVNNILLDYRYQFVYIDRYLDILGTSPLFRFILPLKSLGKGAKSLPSYKPYTLSEELLSENAFGGKNYPSTCRYHRHPMYRNTITTCNHCRPCGHDYYNVKEKAELCYAECLRLSERISNLESEVALHSDKLKENESKSKNSDNAINQLLLKESKIKFTDSHLNETPALSNVTIQCMNSRESYQRVETDKVLHLNSGGIWKAESQNLIGEEVSFHSKKRDSARSSSFPQGSTSKKQNLFSDNCLVARKCVSDDKIAYNESFSLPDVDSPLILKAIIGHQEERIRRLTQLLNQQSIPEEVEDQNDDCSDTENIEREEEVVKLVKTEQRMLAQILRINSNCEEFSNENELIQKQKV